MNTPVQDPWSDFRTLTAARIALGRAGGSIPTRELLDFSLAHARARDAVSRPFDTEELMADLQKSGLKAELLNSSASNREEYLRRPDLGRRLTEQSCRRLSGLMPAGPFDLCIIVSDGLSSLATRHAPALITALTTALTAEGWNIAPIMVVPFARVAIQDQIGSLLKSTLSLILLGERPGLGSPDSLGGYFVFQPAVGKSDADRNCVSNIRPEGLPPAAAVTTLQYLLAAARQRRLSGVLLKDERLLTHTGPSARIQDFTADASGCPPSSD